MLVASGMLLGALLVQAGQAQAVVEPSEVRLAIDRTAKLEIWVKDADGRRVETAGTMVMWFSLSPGVVAVDSTGTITALRPGIARVAARVGDARLGTATITVPELPPSRLQVQAPAAGVPIGASAPLGVTALTRLGDRVQVPLRFESHTPTVAGVDAGGRIYGRRSGEATIEVRAGDVAERVPVRVVPNRAVRYTVEPAVAAVRTGDVMRFTAVGHTAGGEAIRDFAPAWSVAGPGASIEADGREGVFVAEEPGTYRVVAMIGEGAMATQLVQVEERTAPGKLVLVGRGPVDRHHSGDMWVFEGVDGRDYVYLGTYVYDWLKVWDVTDPSHPVLTDSVQLDARRINDIKIHPNNRIGIATREGASSRRNGIVILDLSTPAHPTILSEYTETLTGGVHNTWILGEHDLVYAAHNGTGEIHIIDIADPRHPREVGRWGLDKPNKVLHDVYAHDGYAYLSYWNDGVVMLDAGAGTHGGTPTTPTLVSQFRYPVPGNTHTAWRHGRYLFVGDEVYPSDWNGDADRRIDARGYIHVLDYSDPEHPVEVGRYEVPEAGAHNIWVEDDLLYVGYYQGGVRVVDVSGELRGDLYAQGREIGQLITTDANTTVPNWPMAWGAQVHKGNVFSSDLHSGLWVTKYQQSPLVP